MSKVILTILRNALCVPVFHISQIHHYACMYQNCMSQVAVDCGVNKECILINVLSFTGAIYMYLLIILKTSYDCTYIVYM